MDKPREAPSRLKRVQRGTQSGTQRGTQPGAQRSAQSGTHPITAPARITGPSSPSRISLPQKPSMPTLPTMPPKPPRSSRARRARRLRELRREALQRGRTRVLREQAVHWARRSPARLAVTVFIFVVAGFTLLLMTPWATHMGLRGASFIDALFTAVSAVCVTGLTTVDTGLYWSPWGLAVICAAMKVGGLGIMTVASLLGLMVSRRVGLTQKMLTASETKTERLGEVGALLRVVIIASTALEVIIMLLLLPRFLVLHEHVGDAIGTSVFLGISAFNNGGIVPTHQGILPYANDPLILLPLILGVFVGSLGFPVILNIVSTHKKGRRPWLHWNLHSRLTITMCLLLVFAGFVAFLALEWTNADTFGPMGVGHKMLNALFSSVMTRSGGFSTVSIGAETEASWLVTNALMFVGGGSAGTGGGIKVTTLAVLLLAIRAEARGDHDVEAMGRRIPKDTIRLAIAVMMVGATIILVGTLIMLQIAQRPLDVVLFEVLSAFGTVGLSTGMTPALPTAGKLVLCMLMFVGRTGTITFAAALAQRDRRRVIRYPEERPIVG